MLRSHGIKREVTVTCECLRARYREKERRILKKRKREGGWKGLRDKKLKKEKAKKKELPPQAIGKSSKGH